MDGRKIKTYRRRSGLTQYEFAKSLGVSQTYLSLLESDSRRVTPKLKRKLVKKLHLRPTQLPAMTKDYKVKTVSDDQLTADLAALGYKGFSHYKPSRLKNPADVLLSGLRADKRDARLVEALPWVIFAFPDMAWNHLVMTAKAHDLQNRLGFVINVARRMAEKYGKRTDAQQLATVEAGLERSKLVKEETLCNETMTQAERAWLAQNRPKEAKHWHLLTDLSPRYLDHYVD